MRITAILTLAVAMVFTSAWLSSPLPLRAAEPVRAGGVAPAETVADEALPEDPPAKDDTRQKLKPAEKPRVEVCFVLDTTGSMGWAIDAAKQKIWFIANQIVTGEPRPHVRIALVPYRDKGDTYVTQVHELTDNIDKAYETLMTFSAGGGGDGPENVNQGLHDAINKLQWSDDRKTLRMIYLVGDYPPHNEYKDVPTYQELAKAAIKKGIYINTILCGDNVQTRDVWKDIALKAEGKFLQMSREQVTKTHSVKTPYDEKLAKLNEAIVGTAVVYGSKREQAEAEERNASVAKLGAAGPEGAPAAPGKGAEVAADRVAYAARSGHVASNDLIADIMTGKVKLADVKEDKLPEKMQKMSAKERQEYVDQQIDARKKLQAEIAELASKRREYQKEALARRGDTASATLEAGVVESIKDKAADIGVKYDDEPKDAPKDAPSEEPKE